VLEFDGHLVAIPVKTQDINAVEVIPVPRGNKGSIFACARKQILNYFDKQ
jgi:hypothetical protein